MTKRFGNLKGQEKFREFKDHMERLQRLRSVNSMRRQVGWPDVPDVETYERLRAEGVTVCPSRTQLAHRAPIPRLKRNSEEYKVREQLRTCNRARVMCGWQAIPDTAKYKELRDARIQTYPPTDLLMQAKARQQIAEGKPPNIVRPAPGEVQRRRELKKLRGRLRTVNHFRKLVGFSEIPSLEEFVRLRNEGATVYPPNWLVRQARAKAIIAQEALPRASSRQASAEPEEQDIAATHINAPSHSGGSQVDHM